MIPSVAVQNIYGMYLIKIMLQGIGREHTCDSRIKAASQKGCNTSLFKPLPVIPLPGIVKKGCKAKLSAAFFIHSPPMGIVCILRLIVGCVNIVRSCSQAGIHNCQILIGKGYIKHLRMATEATPPHPITNNLLISVLPPLPIKPPHIWAA